MQKTLLVFGVLALAGCASIVDGTKQKVSIETRKEDAGVADVSCRLSNGKGTWFVTTPAIVEVHRAYAPLEIQCHKAGVEDGVATVQSQTKGMAFGNVVAGGLIGAAIDVSNGAAYDYPENITVYMGGAPFKPGLASVGSVGTKIYSSSASTAEMAPRPMAAPSEVYQRSTTSGTAVLIASHAEWDHSCRSREVPTVTIVQPPKHGHMQIAEGDFVISRARASTVCIGQTTHGNNVTYVPDVDFHGIDHLVYQVSSPFASRMQSAEVTVQ